MSVDIQQVARTATRTCGLQPATDDVVSIAHLNLNAAGVVIDCQQDRWLRAIADPAAATALSLPRRRLAHATPVGMRTSVLILEHRPYAVKSHGCCGCSGMVLATATRHVRSPVGFSGSLRDVSCGTRLNVIVDQVNRC